MTQNDETERSDTSDLPDDRPLPGDKTYPADERPMPGDGNEHSAPAASSDSGAGYDTSDKKSDTKSDDKSDDAADSPDAEPVYNDRSKLDFDPDEGFYTGTAVTGDTEIPGEHERVDDVPQPEEDDSDSKSDDDSDDDSDEA